MSRFELISQTITVRGQTLTIRELSQKQKAEWAKRVVEDRFSAPYVLVSLVVDPPVTPEEANDWPSQVVEQVCEVARRISGMSDDAGEDDAKNA